MARSHATVAEPRRGALWLVLAVALAPWWGRGTAEDESAALRERIVALEAERDQLRGRLQALELELAREREARLEREQAWLAYTRTIAALAPQERRAELPAFGPQLPAVGTPDPGPAAPTEVELAARRRAEQVRASLRALLVAEGVRGLDLLEVGAVQQGHAGPVVFRMLDAQGRLSGSLFAERLRLEASLAGRSLTLVLEDGYESHGGQRTLFGNDDDPSGAPAWRIPLAGLDPAPWVESLGDLFAEPPSDAPPDDGQWDLAWVRLTLNGLLGQDAASGWLRLKHLGGVENGVLRDVHVEVLDSQGRLERRVFADRLTLEGAGDGVRLRFEGGVHLRGEERSPFLEGGWRVWLPSARVHEWVAAGLPGLVPRPDGPAAAGRSLR